MLTQQRSAMLEQSGLSISPSSATPTTSSHLSRSSTLRMAPRKAAVSSTAIKPSYVVISGGTAANDFVPAFGSRCAFVLPVSDDGGSSSEILRCLGGPAIGDIRSRLIRMIPLDNPDPYSPETTAKAQARQALYALFAHRFPATCKERDAKLMWQDLVEGKSELWDGIPEDRRECIRAFFVHFNDLILKRAHKRFSFRNFSLGNGFLAAARDMLGGLPGAIFMFKAITESQDTGDVLPVILTNQRITIAAELQSGSVITGQCEISHPSTPMTGLSRIASRQNLRSRRDSHVFDTHVPSSSHDDDSSDEDGQEQRKDRYVHQGDSSDSIGEEEEEDGDDDDDETPPTAVPIQGSLGSALQLQDGSSSSARAIPFPSFRRTPPDPLDPEPETTLLSTSGSSTVSNLSSGMSKLAQGSPWRESFLASSKTSAFGVSRQFDVGPHDKGHLMMPMRPFMRRNTSGGLVRPTNLGGEDEDEVGSPNALYVKGANEIPLEARIDRLLYINVYGQEIFPDPNHQVLEQIASRDVLVYSCGSLWTSIVPCLALRGMGKAIARSRSLKARVLLLNSKNDRETPDYTATDYINTIVNTLNHYNNIPTLSSSQRGPGLATRDYSRPIGRSREKKWDAKRLMSHLVYLDGGRVEVDELELKEMGITPIRVPKDAGSEFDVPSVEWAMAQVWADVQRKEGKGKEKLSNGRA